MLIEWKIAQWLNKFKIWNNLIFHPNGFHIIFLSILYFIHAIFHDTFPPCNDEKDVQNIKKPLMKKI
jgi:hypothetical protein